MYVPAASCRSKIVSSMELEQDEETYTPFEGITKPSFLSVVQLTVRISKVEICDGFTGISVKGIYQLWKPKSIHSVIVTY